MESKPTDTILRGTRADRIRAKLQETFSPATLEVQDDSARHAGHSGSQPGGETHFNVVMVVESFRGKSRVMQSRAVHDALHTEFLSGLHALSLKLGAPKDGGS